MRVEHFENSFYKSTVYSFFGGRVYLEYERAQVNLPDNCLLIQFGGGQLLYKSLSLFGRTINFQLFPEERL